MSWTKKRNRRSARKLPSRRQSIICEPCERRVLLAYNWLNETDPNNGFAAFGANENAARAVVHRALADWEAIIPNFNYAGGGNIMNLNISVGNLGVGARGQTGNIVLNAGGQPISANITLDDDGGGAGWYFDPQSADDAEFTTLTTGYEAAAPGVATFDLYRTITHELGHANGIILGGAAAIMNFATDTGLIDAVDHVSHLWSMKALLWVVFPYIPTI